MAKAVKKEYEASLSDLTFNSKPLINMLTMLAEENVKYAPQIVEVIEDRLHKAKPTEKLPVLYLMDSIIKNMKGSYLESFTPNIVQTFCSVFEKVDEKTRQSLFKLRMTWASFFPVKKLYAMDLKVKELDPAWPIVADPTAKQPSAAPASQPAKQPAAIHVNPKFIKKPSPEATKVLQPAPTPAPAPAPATPSIQLTEEELAERKKKESERQEMEMRQQLIKKQEQLLQLQQKRLEFELQQTQSKLEEQALELKQKNEQLLLQQHALQQQQQQQQQQQAAVAWPGAMSVPPQMWPPGSTMMPPGPDPMMPVHTQQAPFLPPPPMPPFGIGQQMQQQQQQFPTPMQPVLPIQQVPPLQQVGQPPPVSRDPRVARDPRLARRDPRIRGATDASSTMPSFTPQPPLAVATVPPVQSAASAPVNAQHAGMMVTLNNVSQASTPQVKSVITVAPSQPKAKPPTKPSMKGAPVKDVKAPDTKQPADPKRETKPEVKKDVKSETKKEETKAADSKTDPKPKAEATAKQPKSNDRSPRRSSDEKRDTKSDSKSRDRTSREPEARRTSRDTKKDFDKRDSWSSRERDRDSKERDRDSRERDRDSRERDRDHRDRPKDRIGGSRESSRQLSSRRRSNRSRSRSRSPVSRSRSPRGSDKGRSTATRGNTKVDKFGRDLPRPVKDTKEEKKTDLASENRKSEKKPETVSESHKKDVDDRIKSPPVSKEKSSIKDDKSAAGKSEKRRSPLPNKEDKGAKTTEEAPNKRPRLENEESSKKAEKSSKQELDKGTGNQDGQPDEHPSRPKGAHPLEDRPSHHLEPEPRGWDRDHQRLSDRLDHERMLLSPDSRKERPKRRLSIDPNVHIPKELSLEKHAFILEQAEKQLHSGELSHQQHQELLRDLFELHRHQKQQKDDRHHEVHPQDPYFRREYPDESRRRYAQRMDSREHDSWSRHSDIDHRRFPMQDIDMRVFDPGHPAHAATAKTRGDNPDAKSGAREQLALPSEDKDERTRDSLHKDRDDRLKAPSDDDKPLKSILKPRKPLPLESPLSPEPAEKQGNDSKVKVEGEANVETRDKEEKLAKDQDKAIVISDEKASPTSDGIDDVILLDVKTVGATEEEEAKTKGKKKNKKKKKKGKGTEAEVHVEVTAFEENLEIKPPVFNEKKNQPLMDMDERRNSTDNEPSNVLPAPFREADDLEELFPAGKDRDERRGPGHQLEKNAGAVGLQQRDGPPLEGSRKEDLLRERPPVIDQIKEDPSKDPRLRKDPLLNAPSRDDVLRQEPVRDGLLGEFPESDAYRETLPRHLPRGRHPNERPPEEGLYRDGPPRGDLYVGPPRDPLRRSPPREMAFRDGPPRDGIIRGGLRDGPFRDGLPRDGQFRDGPPREDRYREDTSREHPYRERLQVEEPFTRDGPYRDGPRREGPLRDRAEGWPPYDDRPSDGRFREGHPREGPFRDVPQRGGPFREVYQGEGYPREGEPRREPFREGPPRDDALRDGPPIEGRFRDGPPREGRFRDGPQREGPFRDGPFRDGPPREGPIRGEGPFRDGAFMDGPPREDPSRRSPPRRDGPFRGGPERDGPYRGMHPHELREGPLRKGPLMEGQTREPLQGGPFRDGPPRDPALRRSPLEEAFRERPPEGFLRDGPPAFDPRLGPSPGPNGPNELRPRPLMDMHPGQLAPPTDKFEVPQGPVPNDPSKLPGMVDSDERRPQPTNQRGPEHMPPPQAVQVPVEMQDKPPPVSQPPPTLPHTLVQPRLQVTHPMNLPMGLRMPNVLPPMNPFQVLAEQARANLQQAAVLRMPPGMPPPRSQFLGAGLPLGAPGPNFLNMGQPRPAMALSGMPPHVLQQMPPNIGQQFHGQSHFNPRGMPGPGGPFQGQMVASGLPNPAMMGPPPHLRPPGNPTGTGTPPQQQPAPLDINSLFAKLVGAGILPPTRSDSPVVPGTGTPPPVDAKEESEAGDPGSEEDLFVPELGMYPEELKCRYEGVINRIYTGTQCSSCGMRFVIDEMDRYRKHLDWHFRQNRRDKDGVKAVQNRKWFYDVDQWLDYEEINDMDDERSNFFEEMALQTQTDKDGVHCVAIDASIEGDEMCSLCHEPFEQFFDEDEEVWMLRDAVRFNKRSFHPGCYEDAKDASLLETPTPGEEGLNSSFDSTVSPLSAYSQLHASTKQSGDPQKDNKDQLAGQLATQPQSSSPSANEQTDPSASATPLESVDKQENPLEDKQNQLNVSTGLDAPSTGQVVDTKDEGKPHPGSVQSTDEVVDAQSNSQTPVDTTLVKTEAVSADESKPPAIVKEEVEQPMETDAQAELTLAIKQEAADPIVKTEPTVDPPQVKMEVESNFETGNPPQESLVDEKMEFADPHIAQQETSTVDNVQPMETVSSAEGVPVNDPVDRTNAPSSSEPETGLEITASVPTNPESDPVVEQTVQTLPSEEFQTDQVSGQPSEISAVLPAGTESPPAQASGSTPEQTESPSETQADNLEDPRTENNSEGTEEKKEGAQEAVPVVADSDAPQSETKPSKSETDKTPSSSQPVPGQVGDRGDGAGGESKPETQTEAKPPNTTSEVQNIQAISVIGTSRLDQQRRRDLLFFR